VDERPGFDGLFVTIGECRQTREIVETCIDLRRFRLELAAYCT